MRHLQINCPLLDVLTKQFAQSGWGLSQQDKYLALGGRSLYLHAGNSVGWRHCVLCYLSIGGTEIPQSRTLL